MRPAIALALALGLGCAKDEGTPVVVRAPPMPAAPSAVRPGPPPDPLGPRPKLAAPAPFVPRVPVSYRRASGLDVWLLERHDLPLVAVHVVVPYGASSDPRGKEGLAHITAAMLDEGAGKRGALELSRAVEVLGATLRTGAYTDYSFVSLTTLRRNLSAALAILGDVVSRPRFLPAEYRRVHDLWANDLTQKNSDPVAVSQSTELRVVFGEDHPYGHPIDGTAKGAGRVVLADLEAFHASRYRPDRATCVVVGDVTRTEIDAELDLSLGDWKAPAAPPPAQPTLPDPRDAEVGRVVLVDRADAPQSVLSIVRPGVAAGAAAAAPLARVNAALGGSFTSRLNQDLREDKGWTYGAKSRFAFARGVGIFSAGAAVFTDRTGEAARALATDIEQFTEGGMTDDEVDKTRLLARADLVETFEGIDSAAARLARNAGVGLAPDHEIGTAQARDVATKEQLRSLAARHVGKGGVLVVVGPRAKVEAQLQKAGFGPITVLDADGAKR